MTARVILVDDHTMVREAIAAVIDATPDLTVVAQASTLAEAREALHQVAIHVAVIDVSLPDGDGLALVRSMREASPTVGLVVLTMHDDDGTLLRAQSAGASGLVLKSRTAGDVVERVRASLRAPTEFVADHLDEVSTRAALSGRPHLTPREQEVLDHLVAGQSIAAVAAQLFMSESTVKTHTSRLYDKLGAHNRAGAVVAAIRLGLVDPDAGPRRRTR